MTHRAVLAATVIAAALLLAACTAAPTPTSTPVHTPTASPTPTLAASACTWTGVREPVDGGTLGQFAVALTNTSTGTCLLNGAPAASLTGGRRGTEGVAAGTSSKFPAGPVVVPAGATAYAPVVLSTTTDGGITGHCTDSKHTTLQVTPAGSPSTIALDVSLLHPCAPQPGFGWAVYPVQSTMPTVDAFSG
ncbi:hypothetical protein GCM10009840_29300 [Pseudolysinimonas kribbensis]|uniref:DUF4232 domain-containing protein n=1 Tax=Pseudolysinimonas kribbensis TaxID=433641 RepID=UPI0031E490C8